MIARRATLPTLVVAVVAAVALSGCGHAKVGTARGCVIVDISGSSRPLIQGQYLPGFIKFVQRISHKGKGEVCFAFVGAGNTGGPGAAARFACSNPDDRVRCPGEIKNNVRAAAAQLSTVGEQIANAPGHNQFRGASRILETISEVAPATRPGDEILVLSDGIQDSGLTGDFNRGKQTALDEADFQRIIGTLRQARLLPDLQGRTLRVPYALISAKGPSRWSDARKEKLRRFYEAYAAATKATLRYGGGDADA